MKRLITLVSLLMTLLIATAQASEQAKTNLQTRLAKLDGFYGQFIQVVKTPDGQLVQEGKGKLWFNQPNYFNWTMSEPDELSIICDSKTVWIYTPMVEQVSAMWLKNIPDNRLLLLLTDNHSDMWDSYQVSNFNNTFHLKPISSTGQQFDITVKPNGIITKFKITEEDGQYSIYTFSQQRIGPVEKNKFVFHIPKGVTLDDQRQ